MKKKKFNGIIEVKPMVIRPMNVTPMVPIAPKSTTKKTNGNFQPIKVMNLLGETTTPEVKADPTKIFKPIDFVESGTAKVTVQQSGEPSFVMRGPGSCSIEQQRLYDEHAQEEIDRRMLKYVRRRPGVVCHGGKSLNMQIADSPQFPLGDPSHHLFRPSLDWDIFASHRKAKRLANKIEKAIDTHMSCDIAQVVHIKLPVAPLAGKPAGATSDELIRVVTPHSTKDAEVDIMPTPEDLIKVRHRRVSHESLPQAYAKTIRGLSMPMRMQKSALDKSRIEQHWQSKGKAIPKSAKTDEQPFVWNKTPTVLKSGNNLFRLSSKHDKKHESTKKSEKIKRDGYQVRNKYLNVKGKNLYLVYRGPRRTTRGF